MEYRRLLLKVAALVLVTGIANSGISNAQDFQINDTAWARQYNGPGNSNDAAFAVEVDGNGNVFVGGNSTGDTTGMDFIILKYDSLGSLLWERRYDGPGHQTDSATSFWLDGSANVYITGASVGAGTGYDYATLKYNSAGTLLWERRFSANNQNDMATGLALDPSGNVCVTGHSRGIGTGQDYLTLKYDASGTLLWEKRYNGFGAEADTALAIAVDSDGRVYVAGTGNLAGSLGDIVTVGYESDGTLMWTDRYSGSGNGLDRPYDIQTSPAGDVYVVGSTWEVDTHDDFITLKYAGGGVDSLLWQHVYNGSGGRTDFARVVRVDAAENAYVAGNSDEPFPYVDDIVTIKYDPTGGVTWVRQYAGPISGDDANPHDIELTPGGDIWVGGFSDSILVDFTALNYTADGSLPQVRRFFIANYTIDVAYSIDLDAEGAIYLTGATRSGPSSPNDISTIKLRACACPFHSDNNEDGFLDASDLNYLIDVAFFGVTNIKDQGCPTHRFDFNCSDAVDAVDVNEMIDHLFFGGPGPCIPCEE